MPCHLEAAKDVDFIIKTAIERDPNKRRVKPVESQSILNFDDLEESSDDSDFRIEDHPEVDDDDDSAGSSSSDSGDDSSGEPEDNLSDNSDIDYNELTISQQNGHSVNDVLQLANIQASNKIKWTEEDSKIFICCGCLGDQNESINEIVECDSCGVTVHEACYGISDTGSFASTDSLSPTAPWFCEACKAGVRDPVCELCPNTGGIYKETDVGKWVHLVCALYVPGVAFGEVDKLTSVTLFEMPYSKWGAKSCCLCLDERFARTGVCIGCDAGMCRTYFHVTCAQREGFLSEAHSEEVDQADPFYAHCKLHSDKTLVKRRKRNYLALQLRTHNRKLEFEKQGFGDTPEQLRIERKLNKQRLHYLGHKSLKPPPWVPTQKMPRLLTTSASACKKLIRKAQLIGIDTVALEMQESCTSTLLDIRKKWHIPPAFTVEFIAYYLDRNDRVKSIKDTLEKLVDENKTLLDEQQSLRTKYDDLLKVSAEKTKINIDLKQSIHKLHSAILSACPTKNLPNIDDLGKPPAPRAVQPMMVPTAAALKMGIGVPLSNISSGQIDRVLSNQAKQDPLMLHECATCRQRRDQHLLAKCDTCHLHYHLGCLNPPLSRLPKKSKLYGWQCSECDKTSDSEVEQVKTPRRSKSRYSRDSNSNTEAEKVTPKLKIKRLEEPNEHSSSKSFSLHNSSTGSEINSSHNSIEVITIESMNGIEGHKSGKKRRREKHRSRYSPELGGIREHKRKRKKKSLDMDMLPHPRITIKIKPIPLPAGEVPSESNPQCFYVPNENNDVPPPPPKVIKVTPKISPRMKSPRLSSSAESLAKSSSGPSKKDKFVDNCVVCHAESSKLDAVKCDECLKFYHFSCLDPPVKKTPKRRGYSWHCADCDPTASE